MLSEKSVEILLKLQQIILATDDSNLLFNNLLPQAILQLSIAGYKYDFLAVVFTNDENKAEHSFFVDSQVLTTRSNLPQSILKTEILFDQNNNLEKELLWGRVFVTEDKTILSDIHYDGFSKVKSIVLSPIMIANKLAGVVMLGTERGKETIIQEELELIIMITNGVSLTYRLYDSQLSLSHVTEEVYKMNSKLHQLDKLKDDFVSIASHELRTPMTAIRSYAWMALNRSDIPLTEKLKKYLQRTLVSTERLINLVNDMLNVSRIESGRIEIDPQPIDIQNLMGEVLVEIDAKAKEKHLVIQQSNGAVPKIFADPNKVHQVLLNLLGNSLKFTNEGGKVSIGYFSDGNSVQISISDSGAGISKEDLPRLFRKFSRLDNSYVGASSTSGTGLGLYICKSLVELMKGKIWVTSEGEGKGATFTFSLPIATQQLVAESEKYHYKPDGEAKMLEPVAIQAYPDEQSDVIMKVT